MEAKLDRLKERLLTVELLGLIYLLAAIALCNLTLIPELVKGFLAMPVWLILPYLVGSAILDLKFFWDMDLEAISHAVFSWCLGFLVIMLSITSLYTIHLLDLSLYSYVLVGMLCLYYFSFHKPRRTISLFSKRKWNVLFIAIITIVFLELVLYYNPFPLWADYDVHETHNQFSWLLKDYDVLFMSAPYVDTPAIMAALSSSTFNVDTYTFSWMSGHFLFPFVFVFGLYFLLRAFMGKGWAHAILFVVFIGLWTSKMVGPLSIFMYAPKTLIYLLIPLAFFFVEKNVVTPLEDLDLKPKGFIMMLCGMGASFLIPYYIIERGYRAFGLNSIIYLLAYLALLVTILLMVKRRYRKLGYVYSMPILFFVLLLSHNMVGLAVCVALTVYITYAIFSRRDVEKSRIIMIVSIVLLGIILYAQGQEYIDLRVSLVHPYKGEEFTRYMGFDDKLDYFLSIYPGVIFLLLGLGISAIIIHSKKNAHPLLIAFLFSFIISVFLEDNGAVRLFGIVQVLGTVLVAYGFMEIMASISRFSVWNKSSRWIFCLVIMMLILVVSVNSLAGGHLSRIDDWLMWTGNFTIANRDEYYAGRWIRAHVDKGNIILSDPVTTITMSSFSHIRGVPHLRFHLGIQDRLYGVLSHREPEEVYNDIKGVIWEENMTKYWAGFSDRAAKSLIDLQPSVESAIVVVEARTCLWLKNKRRGEFHRTVAWHPMENEYEDCLKKFYDDEYFTLLHIERGEIYIFGANPKPGVPFKLVNNSNQYQLMVGK